MVSSYDKSSQALRAAATLRLRVCVLRALGCPPRRRRGVSPTALPRPRLAAPLPAPGLRVPDGASVVSTGADRAAPIVAIEPTCGSQRQAVLAIGVAALRAAEQLARDAASVAHILVRVLLLLLLLLHLLLLIRGDGLRRSPPAPRHQCHRRRACQIIRLGQRRLAVARALAAVLAVAKFPAATALLRPPLSHHIQRRGAASAPPWSGAAAQPRHERVHPLSGKAVQRRVHRAQLSGRCGAPLCAMEAA
jgi:hypothetical protein